MAQPQTDHYFVPTHSKAPIMASVALFTLMIGVASWLNGVAWGKWTFFVGVAAMHHDLGPNHSAPDHRGTLAPCRRS